MVKESACSAGYMGDMDLIPGLRRSSGEGNGNPLQYSCLENPMDKGAWQGRVDGIARVRHDLVTKPPPPVLTFCEDLAPEIMSTCIFISLLPF